MENAKKEKESPWLLALGVGALSLQAVAIASHLGLWWSLVALVAGHDLLFASSSPYPKSRGAVGLLASGALLGALVIIAPSVTLFTSQVVISALALLPSRGSFHLVRGALSGFALFIMIFFGASGALPQGLFSAKGIHDALANGRPLSPDDLRLIWLSVGVSVGLAGCFVLAQLRRFAALATPALAGCIGVVIVAYGGVAEVCAAGVVFAAGFRAAKSAPRHDEPPSLAGFHTSWAAFLLYGLAALTASLATYEYHVPARSFDPAMAMMTFRSELECERTLRMDDLTYSEDLIFYDFADLANETDATVEAFRTRGELAEPDALARMVARYPEYQSLRLDCRRFAARRNLRWGMVEAFTWNIYPIGREDIAADFTRERIRAFPLDSSADNATEE